jgi:hypothetical protein
MAMLEWPQILLLQDAFIEKEKARLRTFGGTGEVRVFALVEPSSLPSDAEVSALPAGAGLPGTAVALLEVRRPVNDEDLLRAAARYCPDPQWARLLSDCATEAEGGGPRGFTVAMDAICRRAGAARADFEDVVVKARVRESGAYAVITVAEVWAGDADAPRATPLRDDASSAEAILCVAETVDQKRAFVIPFTRKKRGKGRAVGFGEAQRADDTRGRFIGFFKPAPGEKTH